MNDFNYRPMRRGDRELDEARARELLDHAEYGVLATAGPDGAPYGVPLSFAVDHDEIYFHCAMKGQKIDNLLHNPLVTFTVVGAVNAKYERDYTTEFESTIVHGTARRVEEAQEKIHALRLICEKYLPEHMDKFGQAIDKSLAVTDVWKVCIRHITGKARR